ncbi:MAG TPA: bifunctional glutamate N-acetyltransferase/amino-acid acetyltransferase ArgJ [Verrucomicrobiae bacterium]|nr:bifunctional glutamate N-acetyltransferase/amino-acid acetyltransferase ArgJ [Verrucomicrobiae bacterium]
MTVPIFQSDLPKGFSFASAHCGLKRTRHDLGLFASETLASAAAVFTTNRVAAAPVLVSRQHVRKSRGRMRAVVVNSGNANCCTGSRGRAASLETAHAAARELDGVDASQILVCSTGVIGVPLRVEKILHTLPALAKSRRGEAGSFEQFARAIMTTDTRPKWSAARFRSGGKTVRIVGCAKGSGMIEPHMATMLAFIATDASISPSLLSRALRAAVNTTFNAITVDGDTSTNDTVAVLANGAAGARKISGNSPDFRKFLAALGKVCHELALAIVADGEGAQRVIEIEVRGAPTDEKADKIARTIANSPLVKTALAGGDPNWGRILAAAGRSGVAFDPERAGIRLANVEVCRRGLERPFSERILHSKLLADHVPIVVDLHSGKGRARVWTCDFTGEYVRINASYRS